MTQRTGASKRLGATYLVAAYRNDALLNRRNPDGDGVCHPYRADFLFAVFALRLKAAVVGAPLLPTFRIRSPLPALILARFAWMFA